MSAFSTAKPKKLNPLEKAIKKNPKYDHVQSTLDTGSSLTKYLRKIEEIKTNYRYQQDEIFKRMKVSTFVQLLLQVAEVDSVEKDSQFDSVSYRDVSPVPSLALTDGDFGRPLTNRSSTLQSVIKGVGELDTGDRERQSRKFAQAERNLTKLQQDLDLPYLLLDIRDRSEYDQCHIISALSYPTAMLSRSVNNETPEMLAYKNQSGKIIVVYDDDERIAPRAATTLVQRGYDNLFMLSGGLKLAIKKFPEGLVAGEIPPHLLKTDPKSTTSRSVMSSSSAMSNFSTASKKTFDREDIEKLNSYLENELIGPGTSSRYGSRVSNKDSSRISTISKADSMASNRTLTSIHEKPWKPA
ncbi:unnamed protein product [Brachionus calyciflorus]|uniref:Rhodanese domain-containing protein n=1 Tax=Brachionus calyciflorus TaxID=104777 RepID=A0A813NBI1_9BILA|nr:unnamed protein product [Brachionus calyciflorus]